MSLAVIVRALHVGLGNALYLAVFTSWNKGM